LALLGTDGLVVSIVLREESIRLPIREVMLGLIRLLVLVVDLFVIVFRELSTGRLTVLLDVFLVSMELPMRDVMLGLILRKSTGRLTAESLGLLFALLRVLKLLRLDWLTVGELGRVVICRPNVLELGAVGRELIDRLDVLLLGVRFVIALLELLLLGVRLVIALLDVLLLGVRLVMARLELLLLGVRLVIALLDVLLLGVLLAVIRLELRLDETLLELLDDDGLDGALGAGAGFEACLLELLDLLLLDLDLAAKTGSAISARISIKRVKNRGWKVEDSFPASP
jgi:hypothetical protein